MLFFLLIFSTLSPAAIQTRMLECAKALSKANQWTVPAAGYQHNYVSLFDHKRDMLHLWSKKAPRVLYFYAGDKLYAVDTPQPQAATQIVTWTHLTISGLPGGDSFFRYSETAPFRDLRPYDLEDQESKENFSDTRLTARPATAEEQKEAFDLYLKSMQYLWDMRDSVKNPSWISYLSNVTSSSRPPTAKEVQEMEDACAVLFSPEAELNCRK